MINNFFLRISERLNSNKSTAYLYPMLFYCAIAFFSKIIWHLLIKNENVTVFSLTWIFYEVIFILFFIILLSLFVKEIQNLVKNLIDKLNNTIIILIIVLLCIYTFNINYKILHLSILIGIFFECIFSTISYLISKDKNIELFILPRFLLFTFSSIFVNNLIWWNNNFYSYFKSNNIVKIELFIFISIFSLYFLALKHNKLNYLIQNKIANYFFSSLIIICLLLLSFRPEFDPHHWGAFLGPIDSIRNGGVLLWDTPEQYGLLNTYIPSKFLTFLDPINSFYIFNSFAIFLYSLIIFLIIRKSFQGLIGLFISFLITYSTVFILTGWMDSISGPTGPTLFPSTSGIRFLPVLFLIYFITKYKSTIKINSYLFYMTVIWIFSSFWSAESLIYCTLVFFPTLFFMSNQANLFPSSDKKNRLNFQKIFISSKTILYAILFFLLILITFNIIFYLKSSNVMDIQSFFNVALAFKGGGNNITSFPINFENSVVAISFIFCLIMFTVLSTIINNDSENFLKILPIFVMIYAVESYFIGRSHENNHLNLLPLTIVGIVFLVEIWKSNNDKYKWIPIAIIPVISIICINAINFSNKNFFSYLRNLESIFSVSENFRKSQYKAYGALIDIKIPEDTAVGMITNTHGYISPTLYLNENDKTNYQLLIPGPSYITALLSSERRKLHIRRFINKIKSRNGLIVIEKKLLREEVTIDILETLKESFDLYKEVSTNEFDYFYFRKKEREDKKLIN